MSPPLIPKDPPAPPASVLTLFVRGFGLVRNASPRAIALAALAIALLCFFGVTASDFGSFGDATNAALRIVAAASESGALTVGSSGP